MNRTFIYETDLILGSYAGKCEIKHFVHLKDSVVDRAMASRLLEFLMENCHHTNRSVLKNNLEVIKTLVEVWKDRIDVPTK